MRRPTVLALAIVGLALAAPHAQAQSVHLKGKTSIVDGELTLTFSGALAGLGNGDVTITVLAGGAATTVIVNPGGNIAPGQDVPVESVGVTTIPANKIKNGNVSFTVTTVAPDDPTAEEAGAPNANWTAFIDEVDFTEAILIVEQGGQVVFTQTFTAP